MIEVKKLPPDRWKDYQNLRLEALKSDPIAFGSSYEEEKELTEDEWRRRTNNALFALSNDKPVGMIVYISNIKIKTKHIANIFWIYVKHEYRNQGIGKRLIESAITAIQENRNVINSNVLRSYVIIEKSTFTNIKYPRRHNKISKSPL